jgi:predicted ATP-grasp superfamily ATP-dependent carboligase
VLDPQQLFELTDDLPDLGRPVLIQGLSGFVDAGSAKELACDHLLATLEHRTVAVFDADQLVDYRSRRPPMIFVEDHWEDYEEPEIVLDLLHDDAGTPFLLLSGLEPDLHWNAFTTAVTSLVERLGVRLTVGLNAIPMAVPHTRPLGLTAHATRSELISGNESWLNRVQVPGSAGNLLEYRLGQLGRDALGFAVHVPHYLTQASYPTAAEALIVAVSRSTGLMLPTQELRAAAEVVVADIDKQIEGADEAGALVRSLEEQYDAMVAARGSSSSVTSTPGPLPTADELGAELERFLAEHTKPGDQRPGDQPGI